ncbi:MULTISPECIES: azurin [Comamonas]|jgi:azurin|uniref:Azurin n=2 Tax=Comamonas aquatica TaxID=225991 RepID=A0A014MK43_9BURK|nr:MULTISPECIES: azurin [Comamonas]EXU78464.1 azurin [Comamonas aquatica DA1877]MDH0201486.1 azurin [Comamonas aquatica]MDH1446403.1 azurin [Comamonas aquatica]MDH1815931.1 azurin [Comamonas aquatica]MRT21060.1 azurin [Comamonas sp. CAH-2]
MKKTLMTLALLAAGGIAAPAMAADCAVTVEGNDQMQFNVKNIEVPKSCKSYTVTLKHVGKMPKSSMGHNMVLTTTADATATAADGMKAGAAADYVKAGDTRVIAHTKVIGGGETTSMTIDVAKLKAGTDYTYFCSFPGHSFIMKGVLKLGA